MKFFDKDTGQVFVLDHESQLDNMFDQIVTNPIWRLPIPEFESMVISDRSISIQAKVFETIAEDGEVMEDEDEWQQFLSENNLIEDPDNVF